MADTPSLFDQLGQEEPKQTTLADSKNTASAGPSLPADHPARLQAVDVTHSVLVQAPAGSGKTDLLTRRYLALLAEAEIEAPEQILAVTFTRAATAEMRHRILNDLRRAAEYEAALKAGEKPQDDTDERLNLARRALARARKQGWPLLEQPALLQIETIDSLAMRIAHGQPLLARLGGQLTPVEDARALYTEAARRTIRNLGGYSSELNEALTGLLRLRDANLQDCENLLASMLAGRDAWEEHFPLAGEIDWDEVRFALEQPFRSAVNATLRRAKDLLAGEKLLGPELMQLAQYALSNREDDALRSLATLTSLEQLSSLEHWRSLCSLLLTKDLEWRSCKGVNKTLGFPPSKAGATWKERMKKALELSKKTPGLHSALTEIAELPPSCYDEFEWETLRHLFLALRHALAELRVLFAETNQVDFLEINRAALIVLEERESGQRWSEQLRHLLVDEFQDTSRHQHRLVKALLESWQPDEQRSCFLVGDPMQSIYLFRQAEVEIFEHTREHGLRPGLAIKPLDLSVNFRSHARLTDPLNEMLSPIFAAATKAQCRPVRFNPSVAAEPTAETVSPSPLEIHAQFRDSSADKKSELRKQEAERVANIIQQHSKLMDEAREENREYRIAVLVRTRKHLAHILPVLREHKIPYRAVEIDSLAERQELRDLVALARAVLHPMDRIAWLSLLRAPWCGLTLAELHTLTGADDNSSRRQAMPVLLERHLPQLCVDSARRVLHLLRVVQDATAAHMESGRRGSLSAWMERAWHSLGGPAYLNAMELQNVEVFFTLLDQLRPDGAELLSDEFEGRLEKLFAQPDPSVNEHIGVQVMTIHKAKGLGFEVVIVPGLERRSSKEESPLIASLQKLNPETGEEEFFIAPIGHKGKSKESERKTLYQWVQKQKSYRFAEERKRLFYVAATRARRELHLIGTVDYKEKEIYAPDAASLLATAWPGLEKRFEESFEEQFKNRVIAFKPPVKHPAETGVVREIAAIGEDAVRLRRLPSSWFEQRQFEESDSRNALSDLAPLAEYVERPLHPAPESSAIRTNFERAEGERPEGSRMARIIGSVLHTMLERVGAKLASQTTTPAQLARQILLLLQERGLTAEATGKAQQSILTMLMHCATHEQARWILTERAQAQSESSWTIIESDGAPRTRRADRIFRAGATPLTEGEDYLWIVDYKTSSPASEEREEDFMEQERARYQPQLEAYALTLRAALGTETPIRLALYYPRILRLDWWASE